MKEKERRKKKLQDFSEDMKKFRLDAGDSPAKKEYLDRIQGRINELMGQEEPSNKELHYLQGMIGMYEAMENRNRWR